MTGPSDNASTTTAPGAPALHRSPGQHAPADRAPAHLAPEQLTRIEARVAADPSVARCEPAQRRTAIRDAVAHAVRAEGILLGGLELARLVRGVVDRLAGLGPLEALLRDPAVTDVLVNGPHDVWLERGGRLERTDVDFGDAEALRATVQRVIAPLGLRLDRAQPHVDARLADGSRLHAILPPLAPAGPLVTIRRFAAVSHGWEDLEASGAVPTQVRTLLCDAVRQRRSIVCCGRTGTGKTTLLGLLLAQVGSGERVIVVEDAAELRSLPPHTVRLETRTANAEGAGEVTIRDLVRQSLRMRPDRIVVGEVRGVELVDVLQALATGHEGCMTTVHARAAGEALVRMEGMALLAGLPLAAARAQLAVCLDPARRPRSRARRPAWRHRGGRRHGTAARRCRRAPPAVDAAGMVVMPRPSPGPQVSAPREPLSELVRVRAALAAGLAPAEALATVPYGPLAAVASSARLGRSLGDLADAAVVAGPADVTRRRWLPRRRPTSAEGGHEPLRLEPHEHLLVRALAIAEQAGRGGTTGVDQALSAVRDTRAATRLLQARTAQARGTATLLAALPLAAWTLLVGFDPSALAFYRTPPGVLTGVLACAGMLSGRWWSRRLLDRATRAAAAIDPLQPPVPPRHVRRALVVAVPAVIVVAAAVGPAPAVLVGALVALGTARRPGGTVDLSAGGTAELAELLALALSSGLAPAAGVGLLALTGPPAARRDLTVAHRRLQAGWHPAAAFGGTRLTAIGELLDAVARWGAPATASLQELAADLRHQHRVATEEAAERAQLALVFPTTLLTLPSFALAIVPPLVWAGLAS